MEVDRYEMEVSDGASFIILWKYNSFNERF